jgi:hypothetical protein
MSQRSRLLNLLTSGLCACALALLSACALLPFGKSAPAQPDAGAATAPAQPARSGASAANEPLPDSGLQLAVDHLRQLQREQLYVQAEAAQGGNGSHGHRPNNNVSLTEDRAELAAFNFNGGDGHKTRGAGLSLHKTLGERFGLGLRYGSESHQAAGVDVAAGTAAPTHNRTALELNGDALVRNALLSVSLLDQRSPDEQGRSVALDMAHDLAGGRTTVNLGFTRGSASLLKTGDARFSERSTHWRYRLGLTQVLTPQWLASAQYEAMQDAGYLGSPYGTAVVFGATVPERTPSTRGSRAVKLRSATLLGSGWARFQLRGEYRYFWDNWGIKAHTSEWGVGSQLGPHWRVDAAVRLHTQRAALFYSDNAQLETVYLNRDRQYGSLRNTGFVLGGAYVVGSRSPARWQAELGGSFETRQIRHTDFTDLRTGLPYANNAKLLQLNAVLRF